MDHYKDERIRRRRAVRPAQTIADLEGVEGIGEEQMAQALQMRRRDRG